MRILAIRGDNLASLEGPFEIDLEQGILGQTGLFCITGSTGAGKSTLVNLIERFYDPDEGTVLLDGVDIREIKKKDLRSRISLVMQDVFLFSDSSPMLKQ